MHGKALDSGLRCKHFLKAAPAALSMDMNSLKQYREKLLLSKAELARKAAISTLTLDRVEKGKNCRLETKRKIIFALGLKLSEREKIFCDEK